MKSFKSLLILFLICSVSVIANQNEVKDAVNKYLDAVKKKNTSALSGMIHKTATISAVNKISNKQDEMDRDTYVKYVKMGRVGGWGKTVNIKSVNVQEGFATAYIVTENDKLVQKEMITLLKMKGKWTVMNSMYSIARK